MEIFFEIHNGNFREGPGDNKSTAKAFSLLEGLPAMPHIIDIGCGPGMQTIELAKMCDGQIMAMDNHQPFLDYLNNKTKENNLRGRIETINGSMDELPFEKESFDLIWSEGAIYILGFKNGINYWKDFLKPNGHIVVSEISWLKKDPSKELLDFWETAYAEMATISEKIKVIEDAGFMSTAHFIIPAESWWENYYNPINEKLPALREKYKNDTEAMQIIGAEVEEQELFRKYSDYYGYVFYIMQKI